MNPPKMFREDSITQSACHDQGEAAASAPYYSNNPQAYNQQKVVAPNAACSLSQRRLSDAFEYGVPTSENEYGLTTSQTPEAIHPYSKAFWFNQRPYATPHLPDQIELWKVPSPGQGTSQNQIQHHSGTGNGASFISSWSPVDGFPNLVPSMQLFPPSETFPLVVSGHASPLPSLCASSPSYNSTPASSVEPEYDEIDPRKIGMGHIGKSMESINGAPYAKLIELALLEADGNMLLLKDIYTWIENNTTKASNPSSNGWKNSVRHNLSMNGAFTKIETQSSKDKSQKVYMWMLEPSAKKHGIESTTRFRRKNDCKRPGRNAAVNDRRARSGRRGGWASQKSARLRKGSQSALMMQPSQDIESEEYSASGYPNLGHRCMALPVFATPSNQHPYLTLPTSSQLPLSQIPESYEHYDGSRTHSTTQFTSMENDAIQQVWTGFPSTAQNHLTNGYPAS